MRKDTGKLLLQRLTVAMLTLGLFGGILWDMSEGGAALRQPRPQPPTFAPAAAAPTAAPSTAASYKQPGLLPQRPANDSSTAPAEDAVFSENTTAVPSAPPGYRLVFRDEFDGDAPDPITWNIGFDGGRVNAELQQYSPLCVLVQGGVLSLTAARTTDGSYISGRIDTSGRLELPAGRAEARLQLCEGSGLFAAFWLLYDGEYPMREIDIMESLGSEPGLVYGVYHIRPHGQKLQTVYDTVTVDTPLEWHTYAVEWGTDGIRWYLDDVLWYRCDEALPQVPFYFVLNLAVGGVWPGPPGEQTAFPAAFRADYVRVYVPEAEVLP